MSDEKWPQVGDWDGDSVYTHSGWQSVESANRDVESGGKGKGVAAGNEKVFGFLFVTFVVGVIVVTQWQMFQISPWETIQGWLFYGSIVALGTWGVIWQKRQKAKAAIRNDVQRLIQNGNIDAARSKAAALPKDEIPKMMRVIDDAEKRRARRRRNG